VWALSTVSCIRLDLPGDLQGCRRPQRARKIPTIQPELALLDSDMPEINGYEVARPVRQGSRGQAVAPVAITGLGKTDKAPAPEPASISQRYSSRIGSQLTAVWLRPADQNPDPRKPMQAVLSPQSFSVLGRPLIAQNRVPEALDRWISRGAMGRNPVVSRQRRVLRKRITLQRTTPIRIISVSLSPTSPSPFPQKPRNQHPKVVETEQI
jgi:CheY-like chemotaxis protein